MNDGEKLVRTYSDDKNMMMLKMKYHDNKEMMSMMIIVARTYWWCIFYPSPLLTDSNGSEVCSDVVFHVNTNHSNNLNTPFFSNFINFEYVHLALDPGHPEVRKGCNNITKWRKPSNFETFKPKTKVFMHFKFLLLCLLSLHCCLHTSHITAMERRASLLLCKQ